MNRSPLPALVKIWTALEWLLGAYAGQTPDNIWWAVGPLYNSSLAHCPSSTIRGPAISPAARGRLLAVTSGGQKHSRSSRTRSILLGRVPSTGGVARMPAGVYSPWPMAVSTWRHTARPTPSLSPCVLLKGASRILLPGNRSLRLCYFASGATADPPPRSFLIAEQAAKTPSPFVGEGNNPLALIPLL